MASTQGVNEKEEEKSKLKQLYIEFYPQLVEAVSDPDTCHSLTTQLHSTSLLSEEKKAVLSSSLASGSSFLTVLGVEEEPHLVTVLMEKMSAVKQLQTLSEDMSGWLSGSKQGAADTQFTGKQAFYEKIERQQLVADIERLASERADMLKRLQCCEEDLKTANELLTMREKAISGMMAAVHRRDTDVEEREERISHLKKELEEFRVESGGRESMLTTEIEDLKSKLMTKTDELNEAMNRNSELSSQLVSATHELEELRKERVESGGRKSLLTEDLKSKPAKIVELHEGAQDTQLSPSVPALPQTSYAMSDRTPKLQQLLDALKKLENWFLFGAMLGVSISQLKKIELFHQKDSDRCKLELLQYWLENKLVPTWNEIVQALEKTDQLALAAQIKHDYMWSVDDKGVSKLVSESSATNPPSSAPVASDENKFEIKAAVALVSNLKELEASFSHILVQVKRLLVHNKCDLSEAKLFLYSTIGTKYFSGCDNFGELLKKLQQGHLDVFNISILQQLVACFKNGELTEVVEAYNKKKENFLKHTTVLEFQRAIASRVEPILASGKAAVTITISEEMASHRTLKDIELLAIEGFEESQKKFIVLHAEPG